MERRPVEILGLEMMGELMELLIKDEKRRSADIWNDCQISLLEDDMGCDN